MSHSPARTGAGRFPQSRDGATQSLQGQRSAAQRNLLRPPRGLSRPPPASPHLSVDAQRGVGGKGGTANRRCVQPTSMIYTQPAWFTPNQGYRGLSGGGDPASPSDGHPGQILVKHWSNTGRILVKYWSNTGQIYPLAAHVRGHAGRMPVKYWSSIGRFLVDFWSISGQMLLPVVQWEGLPARRMMVK